MNAATRIGIAALGLIFAAGLAGDASADELLLWNRLESEWNVEHSDVGPGFLLTSYIYDDWEEARIEPGYFGNGLFINHDIEEGWAGDGANFFAVDLWEMGLTPTRGAIEFWFRFLYDCSESNHAYFFQAANDLVSHWPERPPDVNTSLFAVWAGWTGRKRYEFYVCNGGEACDIRTPVGSAGPGGELAFYTGDANHFACVWDVSGIDGTSDTTRMYVDGEIVARGDHVWDETVPFRRYLYLGTRPNWDPWDTDYNAVKGVNDNIKFYDYAKTDFSDRFIEAPCPRRAVSRSMARHTHAKAKRSLWFPIAA